MFSVLKFIWVMIKVLRQSGHDLLNPNVNPLRHMPVHIRYFASIIIACFWCLTFGVFFGELMLIGYNMLGHIAIVSMVFGTWAAFKASEKLYGVRTDDNWLRQPDRSSRCDELTDEQRTELAKKLQKIS
jgi:hypothetical protein